jgi:predicted glycoside hydrolase/deacetylase ChbG (UPF0249 family)
MTQETDAASRQIVFVADDLGVSAGVNDGIEQVARAGLVRESSLCVTGAAVEDGVALARELGIGVGLHLSFTLGRSLTGPITGLTDAEGRFGELPAAFWACCRRRVDAAAAAREIEAQIARLFELVAAPTHLNGHHHVHCFPVLRDAAFAAARRAGIAWIRLPAEHPAAGRRWQADRLLLRRLSQRCRPLVAQHGLRTTQFVGLTTQAQQATVERFASVLARLPPGAYEWMVHPRVVDAEFARMDPRSVGRTRTVRAELAALLALAGRGRGDGERFRPVSFRDL